MNKIGKYFTGLAGIFAATILLAGCPSEDYAHTMTPQEEAEWSKQEQTRRDRERQEAADWDANLKRKHAEEVAAAPVIFGKAGMKVLSPLSDQHCYILERERNGNLFKGCLSENTISEIQSLEPGSALSHPEPSR